MRLRGGLSSGRRRLRGLQGTCGLPGLRGRGNAARPARKTRLPVGGGSSPELPRGATSLGRRPPPSRPHGNRLAWSRVHRQPDPQPPLPQGRMGGRRRPGTLLLSGSSTKLPSTLCFYWSTGNQGLLGSVSLRSVPAPRLSDCAALGG